jgi:hypothetical protein
LNIFKVLRIEEEDKRNGTETIRSIAGSKESSALLYASISSTPSLKSPVGQLRDEIKSYKPQLENFIQNLRVLTKDNNI